MYVLGIDIGSTTSKCVLLDQNRIVKATSLIKAGTGTAGPAQALGQVCKDAGITEQEIKICVATGYGRKMFAQAQEEISELSCHAKGVYHLFPDVRTVIDIGGQDAKILSLNPKGQLTNFVMNDKCAAGTGRFLDVMANVLQLKVEDLEIEAGKAKNPVKISNTCTVFAESEVISQLSRGTETPDLVAGICQSVAGRVGALAKRVGIREQVVMSGGVAQNGGVRTAMEMTLGVTISYSPMAQLAGALGAALYAYEKYEKER